MEARRNDLTQREKEFQIEEVKLEEIDILEETEIPAFGIICGGSCWGIVCAC